LDVKREIVELADLCNICCNNRSFDKSVEEIIQPFRKMNTTVLGEVEACDSPELNAKTLQEGGEEAGHQDNKEKLVAKFGTRSDLFVQM
jgi:hypothetical protein